MLEDLRIPNLNTSEMDKLDVYGNFKPFIKPRKDKYSNTTILTGFLLASFITAAITIGVLSNFSGSSVSSTAASAASLLPFLQTLIILSSILIAAMLISALLYYIAKKKGQLRERNGKQEQLTIWPIAIAIICAATIVCLQGLGVSVGPLIPILAVFFGMSVLFYLMQSIGILRPSTPDKIHNPRDIRNKAAGLRSVLSNYKTLSVVLLAPAAATFAGFWISNGYLNSIFNGAEIALAVVLLIASIAAIVSLARFLNTKSEHAFIYDNVAEIYRSTILQVIEAYAPVILESGNDRIIKALQEVKHVMAPDNFFRFCESLSPETLDKFYIALKNLADKSQGDFSKMLENMTLLSFEENGNIINPYKALVEMRLEKYKPTTFKPIDTNKLNTYNLSDAVDRFNENFAFERGVITNDKRNLINAEIGSGYGV